MAQVSTHQRAIVTGGADGVGRGIVAALREAGYRVLVVDVDAGKCEALRTELNDPQVEVLVADATTAAGVQAALDAACTGGARLDLFVANVGGPGPAVGRIIDTEPDAFDAALRLALRSAYLALHLAGRHLAAQGGGNLVVVGSIAAQIGGAGPPIYAAAKAAVVRLAAAAAAELAPLGVRVNSVSPGFVVTPLVESFGIGAEQALAVQPGRQAVRPADVGRAVVFLAAQASTGIVGADLVVDGGVTAQGTDMFARLFGSL